MEPASPPSPYDSNNLMNNYSSHLASDDTAGITVSWEVSAHVLQTPNIITRIKNRFGKGPIPENAQNGYIKPILKNGDSTKIP